MKIKKIFSISLTLCTLLNYSLPTFASTLSDDGRYETFEDSSIKIDNVIENDKVDIEIDGNTLVNINTKKRYKYNAHYDNSGSYTKNESVNEVEVDIDKDITSWNYVEAGTLKTGMLKPNTEYTVIFEKSIGVKHVRFQAHDGTEFFSEMEIVDDNKAVLRTYSDVSNIQDISVYCYVDMKSGSHIYVKNAMVIEGNHIDNELEYFDGIKSAGEYEDEIPNMTISSYENKISYLDRGTVASADGVPYSRTDRLRTNLFEVSSNKINIKGLSDIETSLVFCYDENKNYLGKARDDWNKDRYNIQLKDNTKYVYVVWRISDDVEIFPEDYKDVVIYESINNNDIKILLNEPLRSVPNGVKDRIIKKDGRWYIERNCREVVLDGSESWTKTGASPVNVFETSIPDIARYSNIGEVLCDNFPYRYTNLEVWNTYDGIVNLEQRKVLCIRNSKISTISDLQDWLNKNPLTVIYKLAEPIYEPLNIDLSIPIYKGTTCISSSSNIPANVRVAVDRVANRAIEAIELSKINPTVENLSKARMWVNLLDDSTMKDELQNEINSITNIDDMQLERKTVTANLDVYIMCENSLSMSLNTNSITFDNYSGVEDLEKLGALGIIINSSLPYDLNAYLQSEIQNNDKSEIIDIDVLKIKESNKQNYQSFVNTTDKIILSEDCPSGNYISHDIDLKLASNNAHKPDVYKTTIKFEAIQK